MKVRQEEEEEEEEEVVEEVEVVVVGVVSCWSSGLAGGAVISHLSSPGGDHTERDRESWPAERGGEGGERSVRQPE